MAEKRKKNWVPLVVSYPDSIKVNSVSMEAECLFLRLVALCDDGSHYWGSPPRILAGAFAARWEAGEVGIENIVIWVMELLKVGLLRPYSVEGILYTELIGNDRRLRKDVLPNLEFPKPTEDDYIQELPASVTPPARPRDGHVAYITLHYTTLHYITEPKNNKEINTEELKINISNTSTQDPPPPPPPTPIPEAPEQPEESEESEDSVIEIISSLGSAEEGEKIYIQPEVDAKQWVNKLLPILFAGKWKVFLNSDARRLKEIGCYMSHCRKINSSLGNSVEFSEVALAKAKEISEDIMVQNPSATFNAWLKKTLATESR